MAVGRNDPCPCGSGRKYKQCCLVASDIADARWRAWRAAEGHLVDGVMKMAGEVWGAPLLEESLETFFLEGRTPESDDDLGRWIQVYAPWLAFDFVPEPRRKSKRTPSWPATVLAREFAERHGAGLSNTDRRFLEAACAAPWSFFVVVGAQPGRSIDLRDILLGDEHHVLEGGGSHDLAVGHVIFGRVVRDGDLAVLSGCGPYTLLPRDHNRIIDYRETFLRRRGTLDATLLKAHTLTSLYLYQDLVEAELNPPPPILQNTDGEKLEPTTLEYELRCPVRQAFDRLQSLSIQRSADSLLEDATWSESGELTHVAVVWDKKGNRKHADWDNTILGNIELAPGELTVSVNSAKRAKKIKGLIEKLLGQDALFLRHTVESVEARLERSRHREDPLEDDEPAVDDTPEGRAVLAEMNRRHWEAWLDSQIPALGNLSPRQAAKTPVGLERLEALLTEYAWHQARNPRNEIGFDEQWVRSALGLSGRRPWAVGREPVGL